MSKAGDFAKRVADYAKLEESRPKFREFGSDKDYIALVADNGTLCINCPLEYMSPSVACDFARWILATFAENPGIASLVPSVPRNADDDEF